MQLKYGEREGRGTWNTEVIRCFQWVTSEVTRALWPVAIPMLQACSRIWAWMQEYFAILWEQRGYPVSCSLYPRVERSYGVVLGRVCRWLETIAPGEVWSSPCYTARHLSSIIISLLITLSKPLYCSFLHRLHFVLFLRFKELGLVSAHWYPWLSLQNLQCRVETTCEYSIRISILDCKQFVYSHLFALCGFEKGVSKVPFMPLSSSVAPRWSVFFFPVVMQPHI